MPSNEGRDTNLDKVYTEDKNSVLVKTESRIYM